MSETEYLTGKLKQIYADLPLEDACKELLVELNIPFDDECYNSYREFVDDNFYRDGYVIAKGKLFKIIECDEKDEWEDIFEANNIDFIDAYNAALMSYKGISTIYSYDKHYDSIPKIKRIQP